MLNRFDNEDYDIIVKIIQINTRGIQNRVIQAFDHFHSFIKNNVGYSSSFINRKDVKIHKSDGGRR